MAADLSLTARQCRAMQRLADAEGPWESRGEGMLRRDIFSLGSAHLSTNPDGSVQARIYPTGGISSFAKNFASVASAVAWVARQAGEVTHG